MEKRNEIEKTACQILTGCFSVLLHSALLSMTVAAEKLVESGIIRLERKFRYGTSALGALPISLMHRTTEPTLVLFVRHCNFLYYFLDLNRLRQWRTSQTKPRSTSFAQTL